MPFCCCFYLLFHSVKTSSLMTHLSKIPFLFQVFWVNRVSYQEEQRRKCFVLQPPTWRISESFGRYNQGWKRTIRNYSVTGPYLAKNFGVGVILVGYTVWVLSKKHNRTSKVMGWKNTLKTNVKKKDGRRFCMRDQRNLFFIKNCK